jgi:hypothetical protein
VLTNSNVFRRKEVSVWWNRFKDGRTTLNDGPVEHIGRPRTSHSDEYYVGVEGLVDSKLMKLLKWNTSHPFEMNTTAKDCLSLQSDGIII